MSLRPVRNILAIALLAAAVCAIEADAQQPPKAQADGAQTAKTTPQAAPQQPAAAGGVMVFIDPATGKIRQPDAAEIGALVATPAPANASIGAPASAPVSFRGPGNSVGIKLGPESLSFMVVTRMPDGKLVEDCVTGDKAAAALVSKGVTPKPAAAPKKAKEVLDDK